jgi:ankyrin repeat protein
MTTQYFKGVAGGNLPSIRKYLNEGGNVNVRENRQKQSMLHYAAFGGSNRIANLLIERGAIINAKNKDKKTPLMMAAQSGKLNMVQLLLDHGAQVNAQDNRGRTALMFAAQESYWRIVNLLIARGAIIDTKSTNSRTALNYIPYYGLPNNIKTRNILLSKPGFKTFLAVPGARRLPEGVKMKIFEILKTLL